MARELSEDAKNRGNFSLSSRKMFVNKHRAREMPEDPISFDEEFTTTSSKGTETTTQQFILIGRPGESPLICFFAYQKFYFWKPNFCPDLIIFEL